MTTYRFELDRKTKNLEERFPLEERIKLFKRPSEAVVYRAAHFHGWGGGASTTDDAYYVDADSRRLRYNQVDISEDGKPVASEPNCDDEIKHSPLIELITPNNFSITSTGIYSAVMSPLVVDVVKEERYGGMVMFGLCVAGSYVGSSLLHKLRPGSFKAWKNYQRSFY